MCVAGSIPHTPPRSNHAVRSKSHFPLVWHAPLVTWHLVYERTNQHCVSDAEVLLLLRVATLALELQTSTFLHRMSVTRPQSSADSDSCRCNCSTTSSSPAATTRSAQSSATAAAAAIRAAAAVPATAALSSTQSATSHAKGVQPIRWLPRSAASCHGNEGNNTVTSHRT